MTRRSGDVVDFFLTEDFTDTGPPDQAVEVDLYDTAGGELRLPPGMGLEPTDPGFVLTWTEQDATGGRPYQRSGLVIACGPRNASVWVQPHEHRDGEGVAVLVDGVYSSRATVKGGGKPFRTVGTAEDRPSLARWQTLRDLPPAWLRVDQRRHGDTRVPETLLHGDKDCTPEVDPVFGSPVVRGEPAKVDTCWVIDGELHPLSQVPVDPAAPPGRDGLRRRVRTCRRCLKT